MVIEDQSAVIEFLSQPSTHGGAAVERVDTHASIVFLAGMCALKMKRAVQYDYLDFSTVERRKTMCEAELRINRRAAPRLYRNVIAVTREPGGGLALAGAGAAVEWLIEMARFDQEYLLDRLAGREALAIDVMDPLASEIARFHESTERRPDHGGASGLAWVIDGNATGFADQGKGVLDDRLCAEVTRQARACLDRQATLLDGRRGAGRVRQCHGDLHLRNIVLIDGRPTLFDAVEFNDEIACIDVLYDLAFLLMDLWRRELPHHANALWNRYLTATDELDGLALMPLFLSCRAAIRAKTSATSARFEREISRRREFEDLARRYLDLAGQLLRPVAPAIIAVGGLSGSGKSVLARGLAPAIGPVPGAVVIRSDEIRKELCGVGRLDRLGPEGYTEDVSRRVYAAVAERTARVARGGYAAIADAVFARAADREVIERAATDAAVPFAGIWLDASDSVLLSRVDQRRNDPSDADAEIVRLQRSQGTGDMRWSRVDASDSAASVLATATDRVRDRLRDVFNDFTIHVR
jgi:aminoglycoside phosphotransferase family enzyme/predicted kinase